MVLWYFAMTCPFGIIFDKGNLLQYLAAMLRHHNKRKERCLCKCLALFGHIDIWSTGLRPEGYSYNGIDEQR